MSNDELEPKATGLADIPEETPPRHLEERVVERLRRDGLLDAAPGRRGGVPSWLPVAAAIGGVLLGLVLRPYLPTPADGAGDARESGPVFAMIFSGGPQTGEGLERSVLASRDWARSVAAGRIVGAQRLHPGGRILIDPETAVDAPVPQPDDFTPTGFFLIRARDLDAAVELARTNPHLTMGGHLTVRPIDDLSWLTEESQTEGGSSPDQPTSG